VPYKVLFTNIGYAKGIDGSLGQHIRLFSRHFYSNLSVQQQVLTQIKELISRENPDLCCFVEIDAGSMHSANYNQISALTDDAYPFHDVTGKYGETSWLSRALFHKGKSNGFVSRQKLEFQKLYFNNGSKRLIYRITLPDNIDLFFAHFSLDWKVRKLQMQELRSFVQVCGKDAIILADFNIWRGFGELAPLLEGEDMVVLSKENEPTFRFHNSQAALDLCIVSKSLANRAVLRIVPQPYSDHAALLLEI
jgi:endonuclease/exonuclease/phosphatase family metal-dependent hydrolase